MLVIPAKAIRARVIADYCRDAGYRGVVCFSCGNASRELKKLVYTVDISDIGELRPGLGGRQRRFINAGPTCWTRQADI